jgi:hypothetical protein
MQKCSHDLEIEKLRTKVSKLQNEIAELRKQCKCKKLPRPAGFQPPRTRVGPTPGSGL